MRASWQDTEQASLGLSAPETVHVDLGKQAQTALKMVQSDEHLVFDVETSGLDWKRNFPVGYVIGSKESGAVVYVPVRHGGGGNLPCPEHGELVPAHSQEPIQLHSFERQLAAAFKERTEKGVGPVIGHNIKFDAHMAASAGVMLGRNLVCTMNTEALLNEYTHSFSLENVAIKHGAFAKKGDALYERIALMTGCRVNRQAMSMFWKMPGNDKLVIDYSVGDGVSTLDVYFRQKKQIILQDLSTVWEMENKLIWTLVRMERKGIKIDALYFSNLEQTLEERIKHAMAKLPADFNVNSNSEVQAYVEQFRTDWPLTDAGRPSFPERWLNSFPEGQQIIFVRQLRNLTASFVRPLLETHAFNGRVHAQLNQNKSDGFGTRFGRFSCSSPNLQQVPKRNKQVALLFREGFVPDKGYKLYEGDWSQCEPRLFAHYSGDPNLTRGYMEKPYRDAHSVAQKLLGLPDRNSAKRLNQGILTGMFPKSLAMHMGIKEQEAKVLWDRWFAEFPKVRGFQELAVNRIKHKGFVRTLLGRRCRMESNSSRYAYRAVSKIIQGGSADIMKWMVLHVDMMLEAGGDRSQLLMTIHDSLLWQSPDTPEGRQDAQAIVQMMETVQEEPFNLKVPFVVDWLHGDNWAQASFEEK